VTRAIILTAGAPGAHLEPTDAELSALAIAVGNAVGSPVEYPLVGLLRKLDPGSAMLATLDRISRDHGYVAAGTDERIPGWDEAAHIEVRP
jgi:hypothetical protein